MCGLDAAILMHPRVWEASGHVEGFNDPMVEDRQTRERFRLDHLLGESGVDPTGLSFEEMAAKMTELALKSPKGNDLTQPRKFNLMFRTHVGPVEDSASVRHLGRRGLEEEGYQVSMAASSEEAIRELEGGSHDVVLTDLMMPGRSGMELLAEIRQGHPDTAVILVTAHGTVDSAVEAMRKGAFHYICKPFKLDEVRIIVQRAIEESRTKHELAGLRREVHQRFEFSNIIGKSKPMQEVFELIRRVARSASTVLIEGKSGTGKELVAKAIHYNSPRSGRSFVAINCSAITETLLESELFGHMKGSFTGAVASKKGLFEEAEGGTIFLDEIGEISAALQVKLLRVLQDHEIRRVGGNQTIKVDVRVITATNRDLAEAVR